MVLTKFLYDVVVGVPATLVKSTLQGITDQVNKERLVTEDSIKQRLQQFQLMLQEGQISEQEYEQVESQLIEKLKAVREYIKTKEAIDAATSK
jgi:hypothetical protein